MYKKGLIFWFLVGSFCGKNPLMAQDPQFSQYYAASTYLNPAFAGINRQGRAGVNYRSQWPNLDASFETFSAYVDYYIEDYFSSVGMIFTSDQEGLVGLKSTTIGLQYAYRLQLNDNWAFRPGVQVSYYLRDLNFSRLTFGDQFNTTGLIDQSTAETFDTGLNARFFDLSLGGLLYNPRLWLGFSVHHVTEPNQSIAGGNAPLNKRISLHGGYSIPLNPNISTGSRNYTFTPSFNYRKQGTFDQLDFGAYFTLKPLSIGFWYRGVPIKKVDGVTNNESIISMIGLEKGRTAFGYSFDYTLSDLGVGTGGAHEISIIYTFTLTPGRPPAHIRELKCPVPFIF